jgi:hypothetical protein
LKPFRPTGGLQNPGEKIIDRFAEANRLEAGGLCPIGGKSNCGRVALDILFFLTERPAYSPPPPHAIPQSEGLYGSAAYLVVRPVACLLKSENFLGFCAIFKAFHLRSTANQMRTAK